MIYTTEELAERWKCNIETVRRMIAAGKIPAFKLERSYRIREEDIIKYEGGAA